jgi:hypothetical protein
MTYMVFAGLVSLFFGLLFLLSPEVLTKLGKACNKTLVVIDHTIDPVKAIVGVIFLLLGAWILWMVFPYGELWYLNLIAALSLFFGLLFMFYPSGLKFLSDVSNTILLSTDDVVMGARKTIGVMLIILSIYIFYASYYSAR